VFPLVVVVVGGNDLKKISVGDLKKAVVVVVVVMVVVVMVVVVVVFVVLVVGVGDLTSRSSSCSSVGRARNLAWC